MKVLLQDQQTHLFYVGPDLWTRDPAKAFDFQLSAGLTQYGEALSDADATLVVHFSPAPSNPPCSSPAPE